MKKTLIPPPPENSEDLLKFISEIITEIKNLRNFADQIRPHYKNWYCDECHNIKHYNEVPTSAVICELCSLEMRPYAISQYADLQKDFIDLQVKYDTLLTDRDRYSNIIRELIPVLEEHGYVKETNNIIEYIKNQFTYIKQLEIQISQHKME